METFVKITWNKPQMKEWLCADNIKIALSKYCENTTFEVEELIEVDEDEDNNKIDIEQIKTELRDKENQLAELLDFLDRNGGYQFNCLNREIELLKMEILNINSYLIELESDCDCPFCKIDELEVENEGLCDENINLCLQLKEKDLEIEKLKKQNESYVQSLLIMRETVKLYISLLSKTPTNFR